MAGTMSNIEYLAQITGIDPETRDIDVIEKAASRIYINGKNYMAGNGWASLSKERMDDLCKAVKAAMESADGVVAVMQPNNIFSQPQVILPENPSEEKIRKAQEYEQYFANAHMQKLKELAEFENTINTDIGERDKQYFGEDGQQYFKSSDKQAYSKFSGEDERRAFCNMVLWGRGYSEEEIHSPTVLTEEKRLVAEEVKRIVDTKLPEEERTMLAKNLFKEAMNGLEKIRLEPVDICGTDCEDNYKRNVWKIKDIGPFYQIVDGNQNVPWIKEIFEQITDHITTAEQLFVDDKIRVNLKADENRTDQMRMVYSEETVKQYMYDQLGPAYIKVYTESLDLKKNIPENLMRSCDVPEEEQGEGSEYDQALAEAQNTSDFGKVSAYFEKNKEKMPEIKEQFKNFKKLASLSVKERVERDSAERTLGDIDWYAFAKDRKTNEVANDLKIIWQQGQVNRVCTLKNLMAGIALSDEKFKDKTVAELMSDRKLQREAGKVAYTFMDKYRIPGKDEKETAENLQMYGRIFRNWSKKLLEEKIIIPKTDKENTIVENIATNLIDHSQLVEFFAPSSSPERKKAFFAGYGGEEQWKKDIDVLNFPEGFYNQMSEGNEIRKKGVIDPTFEISQKGPLTGAIFFQGKYGGTFEGKKFSEISAEAAREAYHMGTYIKSVCMNVESRGDQELKDAFLQYTDSEGKKRKEEIENFMEERLKEFRKNSVETYEAPEGMQQKLQDLYITIKEADPGYLIGSNEYKKMRSQLKKILDSVNEKNEIHEKDRQKLEEATKAYLKLKSGPDGITGKTGQARYDAAQKVMDVFGFYREKERSPEEKTRVHIGEFMKVSGKSAAAAIIYTAAYVSPQLYKGKELEERIKTVEKMFLSDREITKKQAEELEKAYRKQCTKINRRLSQEEQKGELLAQSVRGLMNAVKMTNGLEDPRMQFWGGMAARLDHLSDTYDQAKQLQAEAGNGGLSDRERTEARLLTEKEEKEWHGMHQLMRIDKAAKKISDQIDRGFGYKITPKGAAIMTAHAYLKHEIAVDRAEKEGFGVPDSVVNIEDEKKMDSYIRAFEQTNVIKDYMQNQSFEQFQSVFRTKEGRQQLAGKLISEFSEKNREAVGQREKEVSVNRKVQIGENNASLAK